MAKHCDVCNQDYADDLPVCPHCAAAKTTQLAGTHEARVTQLADVLPTGPTPTDSAIDYGLPPTSKPVTGDAGSVEPASISDVSNVPWSALVEEPPVEEVKVDAPSDADLLAQAAAEADVFSPAPHEEVVGELGTSGPPAPTAAEGKEAEEIDLSASPPEAAVGPVSDSAVDLGASPVELVEEGSVVDVNATPPGESEVFVAELASDASRVDLVGESGVHLAGVEPVEVVEAAVEPNEADMVEEAAHHAAAVSDDSSAVDLGASPVPSEEVIESVSAVEPVEVVEAVSDSGISVHGLSAPSPSGADGNPLSGSSVDIGSEPVPSDEPIESISAVEAKEVVEAAGDSGISLHAVSLPTPEGEGSHPSSDSSVDLGAQAKTTPAESSGEPVAATSDIALESLLADESSKEALAGVEGASASEEPAVSEKEVDDLLAGLDQRPAEVAEGEEAAAAAETEEAAAEEEKPAKPVKERSRVPALAGGTVLGILLGAGGLIGARFGGIDVPAMVGAGGKQKAAIQPMVAPQPQPRSREDLTKMVRSGDFEGAAKAGIDQVQETDPKALAARGEYHLFKFLQTVGDKKIDPQDPALQQATADLTKASDQDPDALYHLGLINELGDNLPKAREAYTKGVQTFPAQKRRFQAGVDRVDWKAAEKARGAARAPMQERERAVLLAMLLISLQQQQPPQTQPGQQPPGEQKAGDEEAGFEFWDATKLAREGKFGDAVRALDKARKLHQERRFTRLRKAQNPLSDPTEDIFLRSCDELKAYWQIQDHLRDGGYLTDKHTPPEALSNLIKTAQTNGEAVKGITDKLVAAKVIAAGDDVSKGIDRTLAAKKEAEDKLAKSKEELEKTTKEADEQKATLEKTVKERDAKLADAEKEAKKHQAEIASLNATLKKITDELAAAKLIDPKEKVDVAEAVKKAIDVAKTKDASGEIRKAREELARARASLKERWRPEEMLPLWLLLLEQNRGRTELANKAVQDVDRVKTDKEATAAQKGEAQIVRGLALRNGEKFEEAKAALEEGRKAVDRGEWLMTADAALKEVSDPAAYYGTQARELSDRGQLDAALTMLDHAQKVLPEKQHAKLLSQRSLIELDAARSKARGALSPSDPLVTAAGKDAAAAAKAGLAEGHYAAGRVAEELGQWDTAVQSYRKANDAHKELDAEGGRYRIALARALMQPRNVQPAQPPAASPPQPPAKKVGWLDPAPYPARHRQELKQFALLVVLGLQAPLLPGEEMGAEEAEKLADEILRARPGTFPFNVHAQALAIKGLWGEALREYVAGIRPLLPREYGDGLMYLILNDPRLNRPDSLRVPNPMEAEKHFAAGLSFYFDCDFTNAEQEFLLTIRNESQDARYFYFLGLARLGQGKRRDALADFAAGAELERANRPASAVVSESLERIQGPLRSVVNEYRYRPERLEPAEPKRRP